MLIRRKPLFSGLQIGGNLIKGISTLGRKFIPKGRSRGLTWGKANYKTADYKINEFNKLKRGLIIELVILSDNKEYAIYIGNCFLKENGWFKADGFN